MGQLRYYSEVKSYAAGRDLEFFDFIPREGPNGGRVVVDTFHVFADAQVDVSTAVIQGEDVARIFQRIEVIESDGRSRWRLSGDQSRIACYAFGGAEAVDEVADVAASNNQTFLAHLAIPMTKPMVHSPEDFALPADELRKVILQCMSAGALDLGSSVVTVDSVSYYVIADCHEEMDLVFHAKDIVKADLHTSLTETVLSVSGKVHDLIFHAAGASGGAALTNLTDVRIDEPANMLQVSKRTELLREYQWKRRAAANLNSTIGSAVRSDPFVNGVAVAAILSDERTSCWEGRYADRIKLNLTNSVASLYSITRTVVPFNPEQRRQVAAAYGLTSLAAVTVKTDKKSKRALSDWDKSIRPYMPVKASLRGA